MPHGLQHPLDLVGAPLGDRQFDPGILLGLPDFPDLSRAREAIFQPDARFQRPDLRVIEDPAHLHQIGLRDVIAGMQEPLRQRPIVGEQEQPLGIVIQPAHRNDARLDPAQKLPHRETALLPRTFERGQHTPGLVEHHIGLGRGWLEVASVHLHMVAGRVHLEAHLRSNPAVDGHAPLADQLFRLAP